MWNGLTDVDHPTQILADMLTIEEHVNKPLSKVKVVFCGDIRNNMSYAWMYGCAKMGMHYVAYGPDTLAAELDSEILEKVNAVAEETGAVIEVSSDPKCLEGADVIYTDIWASMGEEAEIPERVKLLTPYFLQGRKLKDLQPAYLNGKQKVEAVIDDIYNNTIFADSAKLADALAKNDAQILKNDPLYLQTTDLVAYQEKLAKTLQAYNAQRKELDKIYVRGLCEMYDWAKAPDANFTLRMTYGHVKDLDPRDGVHYNWRTVLDGMFEKESKTESDYFINERLRKLYEAKDFGRYAREDGKLPACFLSNNDITGGNSGSGVLNAKGELIGLAFDGNIESLSGDLKFNPRLQRCINVDIRYVLFIIDKFGGASYVLPELDLR